MTDRQIDKYGSGLTSASFSAMLELGRVLQSYKDSIVLVGGWVPYLLIRGNGRGTFDHIGSIDIDLAIDPKEIDARAYASIVELIEGRGYSQRLDRNGKPIRFSFTKEIISPEDGKSYTIQVDFLTYRGSQGKRHRHRDVQDDLPARVANGCELAFQHNTSIEIEGTLPDGAETRTKFKMLDIPGCLGMKGITLGERYKEKDAYDIYTVATQCLEEPEAVAEEVKPFLGEELMARGMGCIKEKYGTQRGEGPTWTALFMEPTDEEKRKRVQAKVYVEMQKFIIALEPGH